MKLKTKLLNSIEPSIKKNGERTLGICEFWLQKYLKSKERVGVQPPAKEVSTVMGDP